MSLTEVNIVVRELDENEKIGKPFMGQNGEVYISVGNGIYEVMGGKSKKMFTQVLGKIKNILTSIL